MKRLAEDTQKKAGKFTPPADPALKARPMLAAAVADLFWDDGQVREPYTLSFSWSGDLVTCQMNDKAVGRSVATTAETIDECLSALEALLASGRLPWRQWGGQAKKKR